MSMAAALKASCALARARDLVRSRVPTLEDERPPAPDIVAISELIAMSELENACGVVVK